MTDTTPTAIALADPRPHHDALTLTLHWISLLAVGSAIATGWIMEDLPKGPAKLQVVNLHASFGVLIMALTLVRLLWRSAAPAVAPLERPWWLYVAAKVMQIALYALLVAIPLSGVLMMAAKGRSFEVFGLFTMAPLLQLDRGLTHSLEEIHEVMANLMIGLVGLHTLAALLHHFVLKDGVLLRMSPFGRSQNN
jgi:cytochrome b561